MYRSPEPGESVFGLPLAPAAPQCRVGVRLPGTGAGKKGSGWQNCNDCVAFLFQEKQQIVHFRRVGPFSQL